MEAMQIRTWGIGKATASRCQSAYAMHGSRHRGGSSAIDWKFAIMKMKIHIQQLRAGKKNSNEKPMPLVQRGGAKIKSE